MSYDSCLAHRRSRAHGGYPHRLCTCASLVYRAWICTHDLRPTNISVLAKGVPISVVRLNRLKISSCSRKIASPLAAAVGVRCVDLFAKPSRNVIAEANCF